MAFMDMEVPQQVHKAIGRLLNPERRKDGTISNPRLVMEEVKGEKLLYHHELWASEKGCAEHVERILGNQQRSPADQVEIPEIEVDDKKISLTKEQRLAVKMAFEENLLVITGGPGTGKTTIVRAITQIARRKGLEVYLCSPTGRAAQRLAEAAGCEAFTIHRLLAYSPGRGVFQRNSQSPLGSYFGPSILICDESSMLDVELAFSLLDAVPGDMRVVLVGDADQLPPVGPGCFFRDLISSGKVEVVRLGQIFRQEQTGGLIQVAARDMLERKIPTFGTDSKTHDLFRFTFGSESRAQEIVVDLVSKKVPEKFGIPSDRIQVLTPVKRGSLGTRDLNLRLQYALRGMNPTDGKFLVGDRVIVMENDYDHMLMNGDIGQVVALYQKGPVVNFGGTEYKLGNTDVQKMELGYAVTIHKSQGSEYDATICVLTSNGMKGFLSRNMLYTALTRGKRLVILVSPGDDTLFNEALNTDDSRRYTRFVDRLLGEEANSSSAEK
jgi:exodeoxyribonuclease V alpha subunit